MLSLKEVMEMTGCIQQKNLDILCDGFQNMQKHEATRRNMQLIWDMYTKYVGGIFDENKDMMLSNKDVWNEMVDKMKRNK